MNKLKSFNIINAVRFDMKIHGGQFIIAEFMVASVILAGVVVFSVINYFTKAHLSWVVLWIISFLGILLNCIIILILAMRIKKSEGNRPTLQGEINPKFVAIMFIILIVTPFILPFVACQQLKGVN